MNEKNNFNTLGGYIHKRSDDLSLSIAEVARRAGKSRQTVLNLCTDAGDRLPALKTLVDLSLVLRVHPLKLIHLVFEDYRLPIKQEREQVGRGDQSIFLADVTIPDGMVVLAGSQFTKIWQVQNVGTEPWHGRELRCIDEELVVTSRTGDTVRVTEPLRPLTRSIAVPYTPPGGIVELAVDFVAPRLPGTCVSYWKSYFEDGTVCMPDAVGLSCVVRVISMTPTGSKLKD